MRIHGTVSGVTAALALVALLWGAACSGDDDGDAGTDVTATPAPEVSAATVDGAVVAGSAAGPPSSGASDRQSTASTVVTTIGPIPESGVPGLDAANAACRAWSRFGGSFQVVAVAASFGGADVDALALEAVAASTVVTAYDELLEHLPAELETERELIADGFLGPYARRAQRAYDALVDAGADEAIIAAIDEAWLAALATRDPAAPTVAVDLPDEVWPVVDAAAAALGDELVPIPSDPSLVTDVDVPLTEQFIARTCPDRGTLIGEDAGA